MDNDSVVGSKLESEYDESFTGEEKVQAFLKLSSKAFTREFQRIAIKHVGFTDPVKKGRVKTMTGLTASTKDLGVLVPIHVMTVPDTEDADDYKYVLLDGLRRIFGALKNGQEEIDAIVWDFKDKDQGADLALFLSLLLNRTQRRSWGEIWHLYQVLELQSAVTPGTLEYLLQLGSGEAMKLKDVMLCEYDEVKQALLNEEKDLEGCYKMLAKLRKEEDKLAKEDATGVEDTVDGAEELASNNVGQSGQLSDDDVMELLEMSDNLDDVDEVKEEDFGDMNKVDESFIDSQTVGHRTPLDPALRQAVLQRDKFECQCCGIKMVGARLGLIAVHHKIPVHVQEDKCNRLENLITLCLNCHVSLHIMERNGGSIMMSKEDFDALPEANQMSLRKSLRLARLAIDADKRKGLSKDDIKRATQGAIKHPMPGDGFKENQQAYDSSKG